MTHKTTHTQIALFLLLALGAAGFTACDDYPDAYESTTGKPTVTHVVMPNSGISDSLIVEASMGNTVCLVGDNLRSIRTLYFNDRKAILNTSFITDRTLIVVVPSEIPDKVDNKIYMIATSGDTVACDFHVRVPNPVVNSISCEYAADGDIAILYGDYLLDDPNHPLSINMAGGIPVTEILHIERRQVTFRIPDGTQKGYIDVTSLYGTGRSHFQFRDDRGFILDWDNLDASGGWRSGNMDDIDGISGKYVVFKGTMNNGDWNEDGFSFNLWGSANGRAEGDLFDASEPDRLQLKFEINVLAPWSCNAMQIVFTPWSLRDGNGYYSDASLGRALWMPWVADGSYRTDGWVTVAIPLSNFKYNSTGGNADPPAAGGFGGLSFFVWSGGVEGSPCTTEMHIDNIRVVPIE
jgi:hypothetical protein